MVNRLRRRSRRSGDGGPASGHRFVGAAASTYNDVAILPVDDAVTSYYVDFHVQDRSGVLAEIARLFAEHGVSISGVRQEGPATRRR